MDGGQAFNEYAYFMTTNPLIKFVSIVNFSLISMHAIVGIALALQNRRAKGSTYQVKNHINSSWASKNMALLGTLILAFIFIHLGDFWWKMKSGQTDLVNYTGIEVKDLYSKVAYSFKQLWIVITYVIGIIVLAFHLDHGFTSAFQTLGLNHSKYTPIIKGLGRAYAILIPLGFALIPIIFYFFRA
jgi:succinate dehydrogenase / fumarate reductase cytochrome b subunit